jgi:hypothetical protein
MNSALLLKNLALPDSFESRTLKESDSSLKIASLGARLDPCAPFLENIITFAKLLT